MLCLLCVATQSTFGYQNGFDHNLFVKCNRHHGEALSRVQSYFHSRHKDRRWHWYCRRVPGISYMPHCYWSGEVNEWDGGLGFQCRQDYIMTGVSSHHNNRKEDRRWRFTCCKANGYYTKSCSMSGYINNWRSYMNYGVHGNTVFAGVFSYHDNHQA